jgi:hypothetical protein
MGNFIFPRIIIYKMSADTLVYDMSSMSEGTPQIFVKKDWLNILDNQNGSYSGNQSVIDTSQLANSNKYMNYREAYLAVPLTLTASNDVANSPFPLLNPATAGNSCDMAFGLKNWFGSIIHSFTLDYNGTTIVQQTPFVGLWNTFRLMTTLSFQDVITNGATMGFYPDDALSWGFVAGTSGADGSIASAAATSGVGTFNNINYCPPTVVGAAQFAGQTTFGNVGFLKRQQMFCFDPDATSGGGAGAVSVSTGISAISAVFDAAGAAAQYKSYINNKTNAAVSVQARIQYSIMAIVHLKHIHSFFQNVPLLKGVFMKMTLNLNQSSVSLKSIASGAGGDNWSGTAVSVSSPLGGVSPIMIASRAIAAGGTTGLSGLSATAATLGGADGRDATISIAVGNRALASTQSTFPATSFPQSIQLYIPAYTFNPVYEAAYLSSPVKKVVYTDIYQYQVASVAAGGTFNNLITNGIANIKSVLVLPYFTASANAGLQPYQSPFDCAGAGTTSPLCLLTNFNVVVAGQNMIYNTQRYSYEQFLHQLQGANAINGNLTDGLTSSLIDKTSFENKYCYYYVNCGRMLPVEESVPKSVQIIGQSSSKLEIQLIVFVEYGVEISIDVLSGARV